MTMAEQKQKQEKQGPFAKVEQKEASSSSPSGKYQQSHPHQQKPRRLLDEMMEAMALSFLVFLIADLRLMSATGRIKTPFETMALDSDMIARTSAAVLAGLPEAIAPYLEKDQQQQQEEEQEQESQHSKKELSPSQCMALVLIEMRHSFDHVHHEEDDIQLLLSSDPMSPRGRHHHRHRDDEHEGSFTDFFRAVKGKNKRRRRVMQSNMHKNLKAYADMIGHDLKEKIAYIETRRSMLHLNVENNSDNQDEYEYDNDDDSNQNFEDYQEEEFRLNKSQVGTDGCHKTGVVDDDDQGDGNPTRGENKSTSSTKQNIENRNPPLSSSSLSSVEQQQQQKEKQNTITEVQGEKQNEAKAQYSDETNKDHSSPNNNYKTSSSRRRITNNSSRDQQQHQQLQSQPLTLKQRVNDAKDKLLLNREAREIKEMEQVTDALFEDAQIPSSSSSSDTKQGKSDGNDDNDNDDDDKKSTNGTRPSLLDARRINNTKESLRGGRLLSRLQKAVNARDPDKLSFMVRGFQEGSISRLMIRSKARFVWIHDFYPLKELTYAIAIDREKKRVLVVFRGAITKKDWSVVLDVHQRRPKNPITEDFPNKPSTVNVHSGFYRYLFRRRKDTGTTKFDEIVNLTQKYGTERIGDDYTVTVIGHSLGAALSTIFTFFASADARLVRNGPIKAFTFGSPYVGGHDFADCFRYQEEKGRILYARFYNHNDLVAYVPPNLTVTSRGALYLHVGLGIKIPRVPRWFAWFRKWRPRISYVPYESCLRSYFRALGRNFLINSASPAQISTAHSLAELQERIRDGRLKRKQGDRGDYELLLKPVETLYKDIVGIDLARLAEESQRRAKRLVD